MSSHKGVTEMNTVTYTRLSVEGDNVETQLRDCHALAASRGWTIAQDHQDNGISAFSRTAKRPAYEAMLAGIRAGRISRVIVYNLDRLTRQPRELEGLIDRIEAGKLEIVACTGFSIATDSEIMGARMSIALANQSSKDTARRVARKCQANAEAGGAHGRRCYGYQMGGLLVDEAEAAFYLSAVEDMLSGMTLRATVRKLNAAGSLTTVGKPWSATGLRTTLLNPRHTGVRLHKGVAYKAQWPALITPERHAQVAAILHRNVNTAPGTSPKYLLTGIMRCGKCGAALRASKHDGRTYYTCPPKAERGCAGVSVRGESADADVIATLMSIKHRVNAEPVPGLYVHGKLTELREQRTDMAKLWAAGKVATDLFTIAVSDLDRRIEAAEAKQAEIAEAHAVALRSQNIRVRWDSLTLDERRDLILARRSQGLY
jgi:site-specific DNA recombinase